MRALMCAVRPSSSSCVHYVVVPCAVQGCSKSPSGRTYIYGSAGSRHGRRIINDIPTCVARPVRDTPAVVGERFSPSRDAARILGTLGRPSSRIPGRQLPLFCTGGGVPLRQRRRGISPVRACIIYTTAATSVARVYYNNASRYIFYNVRRAVSVSHSIIRI